MTLIDIVLRSPNIFTVFMYYHEAAQHGSTILGCCQHFCLRRKLSWRHNPKAKGKEKTLGEIEEHKILSATNGIRDQVIVPAF